LLLSDPLADERANLSGATADAGTEERTWEKYRSFALSPRATLSEASGAVASRLEPANEKKARKSGPLFE
jgi:hypothetical protein